jgi:hypothetical protein
MSENEPQLGPTGMVIAIGVFTLLLIAVIAVLIIFP